MFQFSFQNYTQFLTIFVFVYNYSFDSICRKVLLTVPKKEFNENIFIKKKDTLVKTIVLYNMKIEIKWIKKFFSSIKNR